MINETYLSHHGILGMKWGIRRFQNEDGSLTSAGRRRYDYDIDASKKKYELYKEQYKKYGGTRNKTYMNLAKDEYKNDKIRQKLSEEKNLSKHRSNLESYYKQQGMSDEEAAIASYKQARKEKIIAGALIVTAIAATAIVAKKHYDKNVDQFIKEGTKFHRIQGDSDLDIERAFYAAYKNSDRMKYKGLFGSQKSGMFDDNVYDVIAQANSKIKIASPKSATDVLNTVLKNNSDSMSVFKGMVSDAASGNVGGLGPKHKVLFKNAKASLDKGIINDDVYKAYNIMLVEHDRLQPLHDSFYSTLRSKGYGGIVDCNDKYFSGFKAKKPVILFGGSSNLAKGDVSKITKSQIKRNLAGSTGMILGGTSAKVATVGIGVYNVARYISEVSRDARLNQEALGYRNNHPNTRMSIEEIRRMIEEQRYVR